MGMLMIFDYDHLTKILSRHACITCNCNTTKFQRLCSVHIPHQTSDFKNGCFIFCVFFFLHNYVLFSFIIGAICTDIYSEHCHLITSTGNSLCQREFKRKYSYACYV